MLFDLEPYLPFNVFVILCIAVMGAIVCFAERNK